MPFCGHATIASGVALVERHPAAELVFHTPAGLVTVNTERTDHGLVAELTSVSPRVRLAPPGLVGPVLRALGWAPDDLDPDYPVRLANAGSEHLVLVTRTRARLADLHYDFDALAALMQEHGLITVLLVWPEGRKLFHARNPFAAAASSRTRRPAPRRPRSAATCATCTRSARAPSSPSARASTWAARAASTSASCAANPAYASAAQPARSRLANGSRSPERWLGSTAR